MSRPKRRAATKRGPVREKLPGLIMPAFLLIAAYYAIFGGEYSLFELRGARVAADAERVALQGLEGRIDSLAAWADSVRSHAPTLERIARERFGMIREGETLYRFVPAEDPESDSR